jgi:hypothetical protein
MKPCVGLPKASVQNDTQSILKTGKEILLGKRSTLRTKGGEAPAILTSAGRSMKPCGVCLNLDRFSDEDHGWQIDIKDDLTAEYSLAFVSSRLKNSGDSRCVICSIVLNGLELMNVKLLLFDTSRPYRGRFILQPDCPLEVEIFDGEEFDLLASARTRFQFYTLPGS